MCHTFGGSLTAFFQNRNYHVVNSFYGSAFSNYMGVLIAIPNDSYKAVDVSFKKVADVKSWPRPPPVGYAAGLWTTFVAMFTR